jgi:hypothetical protein
MSEQSQTSGGCEENTPSTTEPSEEEGEEGGEEEEEEEEEEEGNKGEEGGELRFLGDGHSRATKSDNTSVFMFRDSWDVECLKQGEEAGCIT